MKNVKCNLKNATSTLTLLVCVVSMTLCFNSCFKIEDLFKTDKIEIPGLGNTEGELTGAPFRLPDGVELTGDITGAASHYNYWNVYTASAVSERLIYSKNGKAETAPFPVHTRSEGDTIHYFGSGYGYVDLLLPLRNVRSTPVTVTFPAATILISKAGDCQNAVLIKKVTITIPANSNYLLCLSFYCGNLSRGTAGRNDVYILGVVSDAKPLLDLCDKVKNKKINIEEFAHTNSNDYAIYNEQADKLQSIVWQVTDYSGVTDSNISYINSLPNSN